MNIGILTDLHTPYVSGVARHIDLCRERFAAAGHQTIVFTFGEPSENRPRDGILRSPSMTRALPFGLDRYPVGWRYSRDAKDLLRTMDVVHAHHPFVSARQALKRCKPFGIPVVFTVETRYDLHARANLPPPLAWIFEAFLRFWLPRLCRSCDLVIAPSIAAGRMLEQFAVRTPVEMVPNGIDLRPFHSGARRGDPGRCGQRTLIFVGRLAPEKQLSLLLRAFGLLVAGGDPRDLLIVGDGPSRSSLESEASRLNLETRARFTGQLEPEAIPRLLAAADAFVTPSASEVHPLSVIEAMASGLPVVGVQAPGVGDLVRDGHDGLLTAADPHALATALATLKDQALRRRLGRNALTSSGSYGIDRMSSVLLDHYSRLVEARTEPRG